jgi:hypothetical protein
MSQWQNKPRKKAAKTPPFGYAADPNNKEEWVPIETLLDLLEEAFLFLDNGNSLRETAKWLSEEGGRKISHQGLSNLWAESRKDVDTFRDKKLASRKKPTTRAEKKQSKLIKDVAAKKRSLIAAQKRLNKANGTNSTKPEEQEGLTGSSNIPQNQDIIFKPNDGPQTEFLAAIEREVLYGGSAGGGKSYGLIADPMRYFGNGNFNGLILRRTNDELREIIWKTQELYPRAYPGAKWQERKSQWIFPSGAKLWLTYLEREDDVLRYQGQAFSYIGFDELTQHATPFAWNYMRSRLRTTDPKLPVYMRATTNPGGPGHGWVKAMFIDPAPAGETFNAKDLETGKELTYPDGHKKAGQPLFQRRFIPATLKDNPYLYQEGTYEANLLSLPEMQRRQLLEGDWAVADGAAFPEFRPHIHTITPFEIPHEWRKFRSCDYGYSSYSAVHWFAIDPSFETLYVYRELYVSKHTGKDLASVILQEERGESLSYGILDSSCWHNRGQIGPSIAEEMIAMGCRWRPSDRSAGARVAGRNRLHELLKVDEVTEQPGIVFFNNCRQIIADLQVIPTCPKGSDDIDARFSSDHTYDSVRYGIMSRPRSSSPWDTRNTVSNSWQPSDNTFGY